VSTTEIVDTTTCFGSEAYGHKATLTFELYSLAGHVLGLRRGLLDRFGLSLIAAIAPHLAFLAVQQLGQHVAVSRIHNNGPHRTLTNCR
jgi:hypothetical protein